MPAGGAFYVFGSGVWAQPGAPRVARLPRQLTHNETHRFFVGRMGIPSSSLGRPYASVAFGLFACFAPKALSVRCELFTLTNIVLNVNRGYEPQRPEPSHPKNMEELAPPLQGGGHHEAAHLATALFARVFGN